MIEFFSLKISILIDYSLATKNLENEIEHREQIKSQDRKAVSLKFI